MQMKRAARRHEQTGTAGMPPPPSGARSYMADARSRSLDRHLGGAQRVAGVFALQRSWGRGPGRLRDVGHFSLAARERGDQPGLFKGEGGRRPVRTYGIAFKAPLLAAERLLGLQDSRALSAAARADASALSGRRPGRLCVGVPPVPPARPRTVGDGDVSVASSPVCALVLEFQGSPLLQPLPAGLAADAPVLHDLS